MAATVEHKVSVDDIIESASHGVLRALEARRIGAANLTFKDFVSSGYQVELIIRVGGRPGPLSAGITPQLGGG